MSDYEKNIVEKLRNEDIQQLRDEMRTITREREEEQKAHEHIAEICVGAGADDLDGTSVGCVKDLASRYAAMKARAEQAEAALEKQVRLATEWDANGLGGVRVQRLRWKKLADIATTALADHNGLKA